MQRLRSFVYLTLLGGVAVVLPVVILWLLFRWLFDGITSAIQPLTDWLIARSDLREWMADLVVVAAILGVCFVIGLVVKTGVGRWLHQQVDKSLTRLAPGYKTIRELVVQFLGGDDRASLLNGKVCKARIFGVDNPICVTAVVTDEHPCGDYTVFVPTAPIPTSGMVYHLPASCVELLPHVSVEAAMRTVVACGAGSNGIFERV